MVHTHNTAFLNKSLLWVGLLSIIMFFAGLTSAVVVSKATSTWITYTIPQIFLISTFLIITSSFTYQIGYRFVKDSNWKVAKWLFVLTAILGILFIVAQSYGWSQLIDQGIFATGTDSSVSGSYFYIIVALHLLHFVAAMISLGVVSIKTFLQKYTTANLSRIETSLVFWHFLSALWLYVFFFLTIYDKQLTMSHKSQLTGKEKWKGGILPFNVNYGKLMMWFFLVTDALTFTAFLVAYGFQRYYHEGIWPKAENVFTHFPFLHGDHPLLYVALMTLILILSSVTMVLAVESGQRMNKKGVKKWMILTIIGGLIFLGSQAWEWKHFIHGTEQGALKMGIGTYTLPNGTVEVTQGKIAQWGNLDKTSLLLPFKVEGEPIEISGAEMKKIVNSSTTIHGANLKENEYGTTLFGNFFFFITGFHGTHVLSGVILNIIVLFMVMGGRLERKGNYEMVEKVGLYWHFVDLVWVFVFTFFYLI